MKDFKSALMVLGIFLGIFVAGGLAIANGGQGAPAIYATFFGGIAVFAVGACMKNKSVNP